MAQILFDHLVEITQKTAAQRGINLSELPIEQVIPLTLVLAAPVTINLLFENKAVQAADGYVDRAIVTVLNSVTTE